MTQIKLTIYGLVALAIVVIAGLIYWRGSSNATTKNDLRVARETIKVERATQTITGATGARVDAESIMTTTKAQEATREIDQIRKRAAAAQPRASAPDPRSLAATHPVGAVDPLDPVRDNADAARVLQLAREARTAALDAGARLQAARAGTR